MLMRLVKYQHENNAMTEHADKSHTHFTEHSHAKTATRTHSEGLHKQIMAMCVSERKDISQLTC